LLRLRVPTHVITLEDEPTHTSLMETVSISARALTRRALEQSAGHGPLDVHCFWFYQVVNTGDVSEVKCALVVLARFQKIFPT
jgi:hypothetical protein